MFFVTSLANLKFDTLPSGNLTSWIQGAPLGHWDHPVYGEVEFTPERVIQFAANVNNNVRGIQLDIDYNHKSRSDEAAGWVLKAESRLNESDPSNNGLWLQVEWTKDAYTKIKEKKYKYFSPELSDEWINPANGETYKDVLAGGGITNRPFLKGIKPLSLNENYTILGESMTPEELAQLREKLGLAADADVQTILAAVGTAQKTKVEVEVEVDTPVDASAPTDAPANFSEMADAVKQLSETNPVIAQMFAQMESQNKQLTEMRIEKSVKQFSETAEKTGYIVPPTITKALTTALQFADSKTTAAVLVFADTLAKTGLVRSGETEVKQKSDGESRSFSEMVNEKMTADKLSFSDAALIIAQQNPNAFNNYRESGK